MIKLDIRALIKRLKEPKRTVIFTHRNPDPDTLGSAFALKHILELLGSSVTVVCPDRANPKFDFITGGDKINAELDMSLYERAIAIDIGSSSQMGAYSCYSDKVDIIIDHHENNSRFADYYEEFTPACAMIVYRLAKKMKLLKRLPSHFFVCAYAGLSGDTGCFKYSNTTPEALNMAGEMIGTGIDFADINYKIFDCKSKGEISAIRMAYDSIVFFCEGKAAILLVTNEMKHAYGICDDDIGDIISVVRQIQGVMVAATIKQVSGDDTKFSVSTRANCDIDVATLCASVGGGGHPRAAGATLLNTTAEVALDTVRGLLERGLNEYK